MSDGTKVTVLHNPTRTTRGQPRGAHEDLARTVRDMMQEFMESAMATTGTVVGFDGGNVRVRFDDEGSPREVGFPRKRGRAHRVGDRVALKRLRGGQWFVDGPLSSAAGRDPGVGKNELENDSVDNEVLHNSVVSNINGAQNRADSAYNRAGDAQNDANAARNRADDAYSRASAAQSDANSARNRADDAYSIASSGKSKLSGKSFKVDSSGNVKLPSW